RLRLEDLRLDAGVGEDVGAVLRGSRLCAVWITPRRQRGSTVGRIHARNADQRPQVLNRLLSCAVPVELRRAGGGPPSGAAHPVPGLASLAPLMPRATCPAGPRRRERTNHPRGISAARRASATPSSPATSRTHRLVRLKASVTHSQALKFPAGTPNQPSAGPMPRQVHSPTRMAMASKARSRLIARMASTNGAYRRRTPSASVIRIAPAMIN